MTGYAKDSASARRSDVVRFAFHAVGVGFVVLYVISFAVRNVALQWDLKVYVAAAQAALAGLDPYHWANLVAVAAHPVAFPFLYPPVAVLPFLPLASLPLEAAAVVWMAVKVVMLAGLVVAWVRWRPREDGPLPVVLLAAFGWNGAALWDLRAGNVATLECALLWSAFACFAAERRRAFAVLVVAAASFKVIPALFLLLLLVPGRGAPRPKLLVAALLGLAVWIAGPLLVGPAAHWRGFLSHVPFENAMGDANPSALAFFSQSATHAGVPAPYVGRIAWLAWAAFVAVLVGLSLPYLRRLREARDARSWVMAAVFLYVLIAPRPMAYGYMLLVPAPLFLAPRPFASAAGRLGLALILSAQGLARAANQQPDSVVVTYAPFLLSLAVWLLIVQSRRNAFRAPPATPVAA